MANSLCMKMLAVKMLAMTVLDMTRLMNEQGPGRASQSPASRWIWPCWTDCVHLFVLRMKQTLDAGGHL